jgi:hypothetical protein
MKRIVIAIISILVFMTSAGSAGAARSRKRASVACSVGRSHVVVADAQAQVYEGPSVSEGVLAPEAPVFYGCVYGHRKSYELGSPPNGSPSVSFGTRLFTLAGPIVAYEKSFVHPPPGFSSWFVIVRDLRSGKILHELPTGTPSHPIPNQVGDGSITAIVVKSDGSVAWILENNISPVEYEIHTFDKTGSHVLASGSDIEPHSLALAGSTLYWLQGGKPMSAVLH